MTSLQIGGWWYVDTCSDTVFSTKLVPLQLCASQRLRGGSLQSGSAAVALKVPFHSLLVPGVPLMYAIIPEGAQMSNAHPTSGTCCIVWTNAPWARVAEPLHTTGPKTRGRCFESSSGLALQLVAQRA